MPGPRFPKAYSDVVARLRVPCGFLLAAAFAWMSRPAWWSLAAGLPLALAGLALRGWAAGHLSKNQVLATTGPYAYVRNPLYLGTLGVAAGLVIASRQPWLALLFGSVFLLVYLPVIELEEQHLRRIFPEYESYAARVPGLVPRLGAPPQGRFSWRLYWKNEEFNALTGFLLGATWLLFRC